MSISTTVRTRSIVALEKTPQLITFVFVVGGKTLDMALKRLNKYARIACCGAISSYSQSHRPNLITPRLTIAFCQTQTKLKVSPTTGPSLSCLSRRLHSHKLIWHA